MPENTEKPSAADPLSQSHSGMRPEIDVINIDAQRGNERPPRPRAEPRASGHTPKGGPHH